MTAIYKSFDINFVAVLPIFHFIDLFDTVPILTYICNFSYASYILYLSVFFIECFKIFIVSSHSFR